MLASQGVLASLCCSLARGRLEQQFRWCSTQKPQTFPNPKPKTMTFSPNMDVFGVAGDTSVSLAFILENLGWENLIDPEPVKHSLLPGTHLLSPTLWHAWQATPVRQGSYCMMDWRKNSISSKPVPFHSFRNPVFPWWAGVCVSGERWETKVAATGGDRTTDFGITQMENQIPAFLFIAYGNDSG